MAFVANARPEQSDTHSCSLNKGIGWESRTRKESLISVCSLWIIECKGEGRIPKVAVFLKYCFPCREICARWKPVIGRAVMARREGWSNAFVRGKILRTWIDQSEDLQTPKRRIGSIVIASYPHTFPFRFGAKRYKTQRRWLRQSSFFWYIKFFSSLPGGAEQVTPPAGTKGSIDTREGSKWINEK